ncbi:hypothetical protein E8L90_13270 [Brevibacillus antibioticus]|uniref:Uncharacterized protein n=1 Tax=Brevibacillus antibioticus TaxID=2570228 RepID=A0A4U2Y7Z6_9BACL|nr:hypothetical protein [Brevibacillus antibioticus]TKI56354.1 hypothetical protein E8L90_13270 [Brevibacillus antibioticus]
MKKNRDRFYIASWDNYNSKSLLDSCKDFDRSYLLNVYKSAQKLHTNLLSNRKKDEIMIRQITPIVYLYRSYIELILEFMISYMQTINRLHETIQGESLIKEIRFDLQKDGLLKSFEKIELEMRSLSCDFQYSETFRGIIEGFDSDSNGEELEYLDLHIENRWYSDEFHGGLLRLKDDIGILNSEFDNILELLDSEMDELKEIKSEVNRLF